MGHGGSLPPRQTPIILFIAPSGSIHTLSLIMMQKICLNVSTNITQAVLFPSVHLVSSTANHGPTLRWPQVIYAHICIQHTDVVFQLDAENVMEIQID